MSIRHGGKTRPGLSLSCFQRRDFSTFLLSLSLFSLFERLRPRDRMEAGLVYPGAFCGDILSYKIADTSIAFPSKWQLTWRQPLAVARSRDLFMVPRCQPFGRFDRAQFYSNFPHLRQLHYYNATPPAADSSIDSWMRYYRHRVYGISSSTRFIFVRDEKIYSDSILIIAT